MRIGHGYDVHRLVENESLILGGIEIPNDKGLEGYSDADVLLHAVMDAVLGAAALGDIGLMFPDSDPQYQGIDSSLLLKQVSERVEKLGYCVANLDCTIIAQKPKLAPYIPEMEQHIADIIGIPVTNVNVKATTEEHLGFTGREEGIAAHAVVLLS
ncbi:MAG: 2-C-methyl-D-erythritol 2,4-cyclodiphosphate synthase [Clostridiales bacterium]|nr:2-C-methyl-D-erythritol 2,4-cyclodiphosphate synthase [Clostridiales bacterium]